MFSSNNYMMTLELYFIDSNCFCFFRDILLSNFNSSYLKSQVWLLAAVQIFGGIGISYGSLIAFSSYNDKRNNIYYDTLAISLLNCFTSILAGKIMEKPFRVNGITVLQYAYTFYSIFKTLWFNMPNLGRFSLHLFSYIGWMFENSLKLDIIHTLT